MGKKKEANMEPVLGVTHFGSATCEPVAGVSHEDALAGLIAREEVELARTLTEGFISVRFKRPLGREELSAFKAAVVGMAKVHENRRREIRAVDPAGEHGAWDDYL